MEDLTLKELLVLAMEGVTARDYRNDVLKQRIANQYQKLEADEKKETKEE